MNKSAIQRFAIWARTELIAQVSQRAYQYGITKDGYGEANAVTVGGRALSTDEQRQRKELVQQIQQKDYTQVMEEVAYTWFNRFIALRFMEVNNYLPSHIRVFSDSTGAFKPEILNDVLHLELPGLNADKVAEYIESNQTDDLYRYLLLTQCNALNEALPRMFERMGGYTELLLPNNILKQDGILGRMVTDIPEEDWTDQVQIIGWLYQYYISEKHDQIVNIYKGTVKKEDIPAATQLFTTDWVVRYMVDNSLGRYWIERHPESKLREKLQFFVTPKSGEINYVNEPVKPQELTFFDPCMGSGHILVYAFDVLMEIYKECGYGEREAAAEIVQNNIFGLDIDERCSQLAYFAVVMKARSYDRRFFMRGIKPHVLSIRESNSIGIFTRPAFMPNKEQNEIGEYLIDLFRHAKEIGSLKTAKSVDYEAFQNYLINCADKAFLDMDFALWNAEEKPLMEQLAEQAKILSKKYAIVCTNPPYMNRLEGHLKDYITAKFKPYSGDLFSVFIYHNFEFCKEDGFSAFMTPFVWMFINSYEKLRKYIIENKAITSLVQMEYSAFEEATVPICAFILHNSKERSPGLYFKLSDFTGGMDVQCQKVLEAIKNPSCGYFYETASHNYYDIEDNPIAFWASPKIREAFKQCDKISDIAPPKQGLATANNDRFLRKWYEINFRGIGFGCIDCADALRTKLKWFPYNKGGAFRRWYGNREYVVNWEDDGYEIKNFRDENGKVRSRPQNINYYFKPAITWSDITSASFSGRYCETGFIFDIKGSSGFPPVEKLPYVLGFLNSSISQKCIKILNPTITTQVGDMARIPVIVDNSVYDNVTDAVNANISISKNDWDSFETSWDFKEHPLVALAHKTTYKSNGSAVYRIEDAYSWWQNECDTRFTTLKSNEEELNRIFIDIYGLQDELTPEVEDKDVTVRKADLQRDIRSLISYAVGCMFGRYSLDVDGLAYAGGEFSDQWTVVGGQYFKREVVEYYVGQELQRIDSMAEIYRFSDRDLQAGEISAERRNVCTLGSNETSSSINSVEYRRGTSTKLYEGIRELSFDCKRIESGTGNTTYDLCSPKILDAISNGNGDELVTRGWKDANRIDWKAIHYTLTTNHYSPDRDNIIPICDDEYFDDDITGRFVKWVETVYGKETLEENLKFIADALGGKGTPREVIRSYFLNDFYADHLKVYQKRPIYWLFDSGKKNGFKALIYMHRYQSDLLARMRTDYVHEQQERYRTQLMHIADAIDHASASERVKLTKQQKKIQDQALEIQKYEEKIHHLADQNISIDLDDGVKHNYELFADVLAKIK